MKKLIILFVAFALSSGAFAQHDMSKMKKGKTEKMDMKKVHVMMKDGKMEMVQNGKSMNMDKDMTLSNGTKVSVDGTVTMKSGKTIKLKDGEMIYMNGKLGKM
jgi:uncharacterized protein YdeI (BOF family)